MLEFTMETNVKDSQSPPILLGRALKLWFKKRVIFPKDLIGSVIQEEEQYKIFRKIVVLQKDNQPRKPRALFKVKFQFEKFSFGTNRWLSLFPIPFIIAQPGFISKTWFVGNKTGCFQGLYEWESLQTAENYVNSFPLKLMKKRARPDSLSIEIAEVD